VNTNTVFTANATVFAQWNQSSGGGGRDTIKVEAESLTGGLPNCDPNASSNPMCIGTNNGITNIGWITDGSVANYSVNVPRAGLYTMVFRVASAQDGAFNVFVNNADRGSIQMNSGDWDAYRDAPLSSAVQLNAGTNAIRLNFRHAINVDYFLLISEPTASVRPMTARQDRSAHTGVTLRTFPKGFSAQLPANHGYTSYRLIDVQGRVLNRGMVGAGVSDLRFDGVQNSVVFLRLEGGNGRSTVVRVVAY
jgi:hypothetical protein